MTRIIPMIQETRETTMRTIRISLLASVACGLGLFFGLGLGPALAEDPTHEEMVCALNPDYKVPFVDRRLRGVTSTPSTRPALSFDITLNFAFDSAELTDETRVRLDKVAKALTDPSTEKYDIIVSGHTDAVGTADYNQSLSERRAEAARNYLINRHGIDSKRLIAKGYGKSQLLLPAEPGNELNRRVQFQNAKASVASSSSAAAPSSGSKAGTTSSSVAGSSASSKTGTTARPAAEGEGL
jgi:outer membrane protein OmpA-like peptidoglycan-associated protein